MHPQPSRPILSPMAEYELHVLDYNYSSWSMRAGIVMRAAGVPFREARHHLDDAGLEKLRQLSPSALLPLLEHGKVRVWDSLAIAEYVAEQCPDRALWPRDAHARAVARSASAEMHSGFLAMRNSMNMNIRSRFPGFARSPEVDRNVQRVKQLWTDLRTRFGQGGDFLCGEFGIVDAMFAPVVTRFRTYDVALEGACAAYADAVLAHPAVASWLEAALADPFRIERYEYTTG